MEADQDANPSIEREAPEVQILPDDGNNPAQENQPVEVVVEYLDESDSQDVIVEPVFHELPQRDSRLMVMVERLPRSRDISWLEYRNRIIEINSQAEAAQLQDHSNHPAPPQEHVNVAQQQEQINTAGEPIVVLSLTPPSSKKRKRSNSVTPNKLNYSVDEDDGSTCPICLDHWEMSGPHRLTSLKCGHLFGHSCIKRWLSECAPGTRCCPSCKTKATFRDMRHLYAKRVCAVDNTEEHRLRDLLETEQRKSFKLQDDYTVLKLELAVTKNLVTKLEGDLERARRVGSGASEAPHSSHSSIPYVQHKLFMEKNIEISKEPGCRVMAFGKTTGNLIVSQKSTQSLFPGYGVRFVDIKALKPTHFLHMSAKCVRDLAFNNTDDLLISATMEKSAKLFNVRDRSVVSVFTPSDKPLWACALDKELSNFLYLGSQHGSTYIYDVRNASTIIEEFKNEGDLSPVINICLVPASDKFPFGGFMVCKLQSIWFYEKVPCQEIVPTRLNVEGSFLSMTYNPATNIVLISTRPSSRHINSRYIVGTLNKSNDLVILDTMVTFFGSKVTPVMSRCTQIPVRDNTLVAAYLQDVKLLSLWDLRESCRVQSLPVTDVVFDTCPVYDRENTFLAALTENKCRIYKVISSEL